MPRIQINRDAVALRMLDDPAFIAQWTRLCLRCPWSTTYQQPAFAATWYRVYAQSFEPVLVTSHTGSGDLCGILCLTASRSDASLKIAGEEQSEYQTWVNDPEEAPGFPAEAICAVRKEFPGDVLEFRYLPPAIPLGWLNDPRLRSTAVLSRKKRPLLRFSAMEEDSLNKANNKKRLKVLRKHGEIEFSRITDPGELTAVLDEIAPCYDLRLGAMHGYEPFGKDPVRKQFQLELMKQEGMLHVSVLRVGKLLAAAHVNVRDGKQLHLHLVCYNPLLARYSPGKFHIHLLAKMLIAEQYEEIDLTPGGDPYKERFANTHDTAHILSFHPTRRSRFHAALRAGADSAMRRGLAMARVHPARARDRLQSLQHLSLAKLCSAAAARVRDRMSIRAAIRLYAKPITPRPAAPSQNLFVRDRIEQLLHYRPAGGDVSRKQFLSDSLNRLEQGQHLYSCVTDGALRCVGWVMEHPSEVFLSRVLPGVKLPADCALILDIRPLGPSTFSAGASAFGSEAHAQRGEVRGVGQDWNSPPPQIFPGVSGEGERLPLPELASACLAQILADLAQSKGITRVMMAVRPDHIAVPLLASAGFAWESSLFRGKVQPVALRGQTSRTILAALDDEVEPAASTMHE